MERAGYRCNTMVITTGIREVNKNLFYNLTSISAYDELFELNLTRDTYKILYHLAGKYVIPAEGSLGRADEVVTDDHPDDGRISGILVPGQMAMSAGRGEDHSKNGCVN
ncbi:MAG: hypothetical protein ACLUOI_38665 [Eisenbergiella sp.]